MRWEVGGSFKSKGIYVYPWLIHVDVWQKPTQYFKSIILQSNIYIYIYIFFFFLHKGVVDFIFQKWLQIYELSSMLLQDLSMSIKKLNQCFLL